MSSFGFFYIGEQYKFYLNSGTSSIEVFYLYHSGEEEYEAEFTVSNCDTLEQFIEKCKQWEAKRT